jgi:hypothetical protein
MTDSDLGLSRPPGYSDAEWAAYQDGAQRMLELAGSFLLSMAGDVDGGHPPPQTDGETATDAVGAGVDTTTDAGDGTDRDADLPETCPDCGMDLVYEMGRDDGACPNCDLL